MEAENQFKEQFRHVYITDDKRQRTASQSNLQNGEDYRIFSVILDKATGLCTLYIDNIRDEVQNQQAFHVSPVRGRWGEGKNTPFVPNEDAVTIGPAMAFAFKPILLKMGMVLVPGSFFYEIRKDANKEKYLLSNVKKPKKQKNHDSQRINGHRE